MVAFSPEPGRRYDMPAVFGPSAVPDTTVVADASCIVLSFSTSRAAAEALVPRHFTIPDAPTLSVAYVAYPHVDYLGGRSYNEIVVTVSAAYGAGGDRIEAAFAPVLWVNKVGALIAGREYMGLAKLLAEIPDAIEEGSRVAFSCSEENALLLSGSAGEMRRLEPSALERLNARAKEVRTFGWKYIPGPSGVSDVDLPVLNLMRWNYRTAASGEGRLQFHTPEPQAAPFSNAALRVLATLPVLGPIRAFHGRGQATIDRAATRNLAPVF